MSFAVGLVGVVRGEVVMDEGSDVVFDGFVVDLIFHFIFQT